MLLERGSPLCRTVPSKDTAKLQHYDLVACKIVITVEQINATHPSGSILNSIT